MVVTKTDNFGQGEAFAPGRLDPAELTHCGDRAFGLDDQADELDHPATDLSHPRVAHSLQRGIESAASAWKRGFHQQTVWPSCSSLISRRASISPNLVWTMQPPRLTSEETTNRNGPLSGRPSRTLESCLR